MRAILLFALVTAGCGFSGASGDPPNPAIDASSVDDAPPTSTDGATTDATITIDAAPDAPPQPNSCGAGYTTVANAGLSTYRKVNNPTSWAAANQECTSDPGGAHLVIPDSQAEADAIFDFVNPDQQSRFYWAGIEDMDDNGTWVTVLGTPYPNPPFAPSEPNNNDDCILVNANGAFHDFRCDASQEYACECPP